MVTKNAIIIMDYKTLKHLNLALIITYIIDKSAIIIVIKSIFFLFFLSAGQLEIKMTFRQKTFIYFRQFSVLFTKVALMRSWPVRLRFFVPCISV